MHNFQEAKGIRDGLEAAYYLACEQLKEFLSPYPATPMGLTPDHVKEMPAYKALKESVDHAFLKLQSYNKGFVKQYKKELAQERKNRIAKGAYANKKGGF